MKKTSVSDIKIELANLGWDDSHVDRSCRTGCVARKALSRDRVSLKVLDDDEHQSCRVCRM